MARKYVKIFARGHYLFREANSFPRAASLEGNCELRGTDNVRGQISEDIFARERQYLMGIWMRKMEAKIKITKIINDKF